MRPLSARTAAVNEAVVVFEGVETRDTVIGASSQLSSCFNQQGQPTAGIRIEVPSELKVVFNTLQRFVQQLRLRHGQETRHHTKCEDSKQRLYPNVKLPGEERWSRVEREFAATFADTFQFEQFLTLSNLNSF